MVEPYVYNVYHDISDRFHVHHCSDCRKLRAEIEERGTHFSPAESVGIAQTWKPYGRIVGHDQEGTTVRLRNGETFQITHHKITVPQTPNHEWLRGVMEHTQSHWGGAFYTGGGRMTENGFVPPEKPSKKDNELRLMYRAYAHVFGVEYDDRDEPFHPLSKRELAKLPKLIAEIEKVHGVKARGPSSGNTDFDPPPPESPRDPGGPKGPWTPPGGGSGGQGQRPNVSEQPSAPPGEPPPNGGRGERQRDRVRERSTYEDERRREREREQQRDDGKGRQNNDSLAEQARHFQDQQQNEQNARFHRDQAGEGRQNSAAKHGSIADPFKAMMARADQVRKAREQEEAERPYGRGRQRGRGLER